MTTYHPYKVNLSEGQKDKLEKAIRGRNPISLRLKNSQLSQGKGAEIKVSKSQAQKVGGSLFSALFPLARSAAPMLAKTLGLSALAGLASEGASQVVKKISGSGQRASRRPQRAMTGGFLIPQDKIQKLIDNKHLLTSKQKEQILTALQSGGQVMVKPTAKQSGGALGALLASIGIPLAIEAVNPYLEKVLQELADQKEKERRELADQKEGKERRDWAVRRLCFFNALLQSWGTGSRRPLGDVGWGKKNPKKEKDFCWDRKAHSTTSQFSGRYCKKTKIRQ